MCRSARTRWQLTGGSGVIVGGQVNSADGTPLAVSGAGGHINNVALNANLAIQNGATLSVDGTFNPLRPVTVEVGTSNVMAATLNYSDEKVLARGRQITRPYTCCLSREEARCRSPDRVEAHLGI